MPLPPIYDPEAVKPMWQELATVGVEPLTTPDLTARAFDTRMTEQDAGKRFAAALLEEMGW